MGFGDTSKKDRAKASSSSAAAARATAAEEEAWQETDKGLLKKDARAAAREGKADARLAAKAERQQLEAVEVEQVSRMKGAQKGSAKITQAELARRQALMAAAAPKPKKTAKSVTVPQPEVEENTNRQTGTVDASGIDAMLQVLGEPGTASKSSRMTYKEFEAANLPGIKDDNPGLKMSQLKDRCFKLWERSPENPKNQAQEEADAAGPPV